MPGVAKAAISVFVLSSMAAALLWFSFPVAVPRTGNPPFAIALTSDPGGSLWLKARTEQALLDGDRVKLSFEIAGNAGSKAAFALGGSFVDARPNCEGLAFKLEERVAVEGEDVWNVLVRYAQRRPGTGPLDGASWRELISEPAAKTWAVGQTLLIARDVELIGPTERSFRESDTSAAEYFSLGTATVTCTFDKEAMVEQALYRQRVRAPDLVASHSARSGDGVVQVAYQLDVKPSTSSVTLRSSLGDATSRVDDDEVVTTYTTDWWSRGGEGARTALQSGGSISLEPQVAAGWRSASRLAAGVLITVAIAIATAAIAVRVDNSKWGSK